MIKRYFIADLHLTEVEPETTAGFFRFLKMLPDKCELYILGDFFDYWVGDDLMTEIQKQIAEQLYQLHKKLITVYFICGNRDFLVGNRFAKLTKINLLPDLYLIDETSTLLLHGDLLCTQDLKYQQFRAKMHQKWRRKLFLFLPKWIRLWIANKIREKSKLNNSFKSMQLMDVESKTVEMFFKQYKAKTMIHGHTHKPTQEHLQELNATRFVLAAWHDSFNYLYQDENGVYHYCNFE